jgi:glycosyl transferase family 25
MKPDKHKIETVVVSLKDALDRRDEVKDNLDANVQLSWRFFDACTAETDVGIESSERIQISRFGRSLSAGEVGCFKSHFKVMTDFVANSNSEWLLVIEDDVWLDPRFDLKEVTDVCKNNNINYMRLYAKAYKPAKFVHRISRFNQIIRFSTDPYGTQAYLINKAGATRFIESLDGINVPIDDELGRFWNNSLTPYAVFPFPAIERNVHSQIEQSRVAGTRQRKKFELGLILFRISEKVKKTIYNLTR